MAESASPAGGAGVKRRQFMLDVGVQHEQGMRPAMEDKHTMELNLNLSLCAEACPQTLLGVYDGHGGAEVSEFIEKTFPALLQKATLARQARIDTATRANIVEAVKEALEEAVLELDSLILDMCAEKDLRNVGSTLTVVYLVGDQLFTANVGDSRSILSHGDTCVALTIDHKPNLPEEEQRVRDAGGFVVMGRVMGKLAVARALGDADFKLESSPMLQEFNIKSPVVVAQPDISARLVTEPDKFILLACDGLFDVMRNEEVSSFVNLRLDRGSTAEAICKSLVIEAIKNRGSRDNVTVMLAVLVSL